MIESLKSTFKRKVRGAAASLSLDAVEREERILINQGRILSHMLSSSDSDDIRDYEFQIFSQWGEDGILQFLVRKTQPDNRTFIEFGVETFVESSCRFLMMKDGWRGMILDGSADNIRAARERNYTWRHGLITRQAFITRDNVNALLESGGLGKRPGILSIDIDGVDYFVLEALADWQPTILIVEYNALFGARAAVSVPYDPAFYRGHAHHSNAYYGASLKAFEHLLKPRGYALVGTNTAGNNAFFVRRDRLWAPGAERAAEDAFQPAQFRETRDPDGALDYLEVDEVRRNLAELPLVDVVSGRSTKIGDIAV